MDELTHREDCPCPKKCRRHGSCEECRKHHQRLSSPPYCERKGKSGEEKS